MRTEFKQFTSTHFVTSSPVKQRLLKKTGYPIIKEPELLDRIGRAEGTQSLFLEDNDPERPVVLEIARKKAEGLLPASQLVATFGGNIIPLIVNDTVWNFVAFQGDGRTRTIVNKPNGNGDTERIRQFYQEAKGSLVYSSAGLCVVTPDPINPIPYSFFTKLRLGQWTGQVPEDFEPNKNYSFGMDSISAIESGFIDPHGAMKFELIVFDDSMQGLRTQSNFATRIPFTGDKENLELAHALGAGIIPEQILEQLQEPIRVQQFEI